MERSIIRFLIISGCLWVENFAQNSAVPTVSINNDSGEETNTSDSSLVDLMQLQADAVKKIVSVQHHQHQTQQNSPSAESDFETNEEGSNRYNSDNLHDLQLRCKHLASWLAKTSANHNYTQPHPFYRPYRPNNGFYITINPGGNALSSTQPTTPTTTTTTTAASTTSDSSAQAQQSIAQNVKLIKLEPVILQKTLLSDGRVIYYWHKSLPSAGNYPPLHQGYISDRLDVHNAPQSTTPTTTTTTTAPSSGLDFRNFFPSFYSIGGAQQSTATTTEKTTTPTPSNDELLYSHQLKFVVPIPYTNADNAIPVKKPWEFDQFAYYPKPLQPETINVQVPYVPTFHFIKALAVPNSPLQQAPLSPADTGTKNEDYHEQPYADTSVY